VTCQAFNGAGTIYAYAVSYDWHAGARGYVRQEQNQIFLHAVKEAEICPRPGNPGQQAFGN
jgi:mRNA export factor